MDEVQSWWEVPAIAHFCYAFREAFNLLYFEIGELEASILNVQDPEMSISLDQLVIRLLQGCFGEKEVGSDNWETKLRELFEENCDEENPVEGTSFYFLSTRLKVEVLHQLCQFRLDAEGALDVIKDIPAEDMKACCVGKDSQNNLYWYFCDERLYKEDPSIKTKKTTASAKSANIKNSTTKNGKRITTRERKPVLTQNNNAWSIVCYNVSDWEALVSRFTKSKNSNEKELVNRIKTKFLPLLKDVVSEKDQLLRKRYLEIAPKRVSSRISKVQAQRKMEEQRAAEAAEAKRIEQEKEREKREAEKKINEKDERRKRAEQREKIIQGRFLRVKQREMMRGHSTDEESSSEETHLEGSRPKRACRARTTFGKRNTNEESEEEASSNKEETSSNEEEVSANEEEASAKEEEVSANEEEASANEEEESANEEEESANEEEALANEDKGSSDDGKCDASESARSSKEPSKYQSVNNDNSEDESEEDSFSKHPLPSETAAYSVSQREQKGSVRPSVIPNSYNSKWNREVDTVKHKASNISYTQFPGNKRLKPNEVSNFNLKSVNTIPAKDSAYYNENHNWYLKTCSKVTSSPNIIRIDFIKPPAKPQS